MNTNLPMIKPRCPFPRRRRVAGHVHRREQPAAAPLSATRGRRATAGLIPITATAAASWHPVAMSETATPQPQRDGPTQTRKLGRSKPFTAATVPPRMREWHAPRVNRWECLCVTAGTLTLEQMHGTEIQRLELTSDTARWFAPGVRWRIARITEDGQFELEVHAADKGQAAQPQPLRSDWLENAERRTVKDAAELAQALDTLAVGQRRLLDLTGAAHTAAAERAPDATLSWHPLSRRGDGITALATRAREPFDLGLYLGRDHAVIEAALGGMLAGKSEFRCWLLQGLARHMHIEEQLLFPAYRAAGGREAWIKGLIYEHELMRGHMADLDDADNRRKFLRLLDAHDEKEERVIYPDILRHVETRADNLLARAMLWPLPQARDTTSSAG